MRVELIRPELLLRFVLDGETREIDEYLALAWRYTDDPGESVTSLINGFKTGAPSSVQRSVDLARERLPRYIRRIYPQASISVLGAIPSRAETLDPAHNIAHLSRALAQDLGGTLYNQLLSKRAHRSLHDINGASNRDDEVAGAYTCSARIPGNLLVIVDDLVTRGSTIGNIGIAARQAGFRGTIVGFALGKTDRACYLKDSHHSPSDNSHIGLE